MKLLRKVFPFLTLIILTALEVDGQLTCYTCVNCKDQEMTESSNCRYCINTSVFDNTNKVTKVDRGCGTADNCVPGIYVAGSVWMERHCCRTDKCNSGSMLVPTVFTLLAMALLTGLFPSNT